MDKVIEAMADIIRSLSGNLEPEKIAGILLNLCYDCERCHWNKVVFDERNDRAICPNCNGTGNGSWMLAVLAENQEPLENTYHIDRPDIIYIVQQDMLKTDANGYAFRRVKVKEE